MNLRSFMDKLHAEGINEYIDLPEIAVMGDTSTGKSSLLSSIAEIQLPSNDNLTTRCPLRLRMEKRDKESASIRIKWHSSSSYKEDSDHFLDSLEWSDIPAKISELQKIIIDASEKAVARDIIEVNVYGPSCTDLTLIDLPGIVRNLGKDDHPTLIDDIKNLTSDYLANERCVVLAVIPANVDFHNCGIIQDAKVHDPTTRRTLPVITKPDLIDPGGESSVKALLLGEKMDTFHYGFHMVKCRGQKELNDEATLEDGMRKEKTFFDSKEPWRSTSAQRPELFGIAALREKLSALQLVLIRESISGIMEEISTKMGEAAKELDGLGDLMTTDYERRQYFRRLSERAMTAVHEMQTGLLLCDSSDGKSIVTVQQDLFDNFGSDVLRQKLANISKVSVGTDVIVTLEAGDEKKGTVVGTSSNSEKICVTDEQVGKQSSNVEHPFLRSGLQDACTDKNCAFCSDESTCYHKDAYTKVSDDTVAGYKHYLPLDKDYVRCDPKWLKKLIADNRNNDLRCFLSATLFTSIVRNMIRKDWKPLCEKLVEESHKLLLKFLTSSFEKEFKARYDMLWITVKDTISSVLNSGLDTLKEALDNVLDMDTHPYTQNHYLFDNINKKRNDPLKKNLINMLKGISGEDEDAGQQAVNLVKAVFDANSRKSMDDHVAEEMEIVLDSYGKVCAKRINDQVPMHVMNFNRQALLELEKRMSSFTDSELNSLIADGPEFAAKHGRAKDKLAKMKKAHDCFKAFRNA